MLNMLVGMKDSNVKYVINDLAASQDKKKPLDPPPFVIFLLCDDGELVCVDV